MMRKAVWTPEAEEDLEAIIYYVAAKEGRSRVAEQIAAGIRETCAKLAANPAIGQVEDRFANTCRRFTFKRWVILYRPFEQGIAVLRIVDGARDFDRLFGDN